MPHIVGIINLKGGVGKTTLTVGLAEHLSARHGKRVLVLDLDPQTSATLMLIGEQRWRALNEAGHTIATLFRHAVDQSGQPFDLEKTLQIRVSNVSNATTIDLFPSSLDLIDAQDRLSLVQPGPFYAQNPLDVLARGIDGRLDGYDIVLVDCPPSLALITLNGLRLCDHILIPTIPDFLSTYGIPQIVNRVARFSGEIGRPIGLLGLVICKYQQNSSVHNATLRELRRAGHPRVFNSIIPQSNQFAAVADYGAPLTLNQKWGGGSFGTRFSDLTQEVLTALEEGA